MSASSVAGAGVAPGGLSSSNSNLSPEKLALAQRHFQRGEQAFRERKYDVSLDEFTTAYEISREPDLLYNLHKVALKLGQKEMALSYLREYRSHRPPADQPAIDKEMADVAAADVKPETAADIEPVAPPPPPPLPPPPPPEPTELTRPPRTAGLTLLSLGGAFVASGAVLLGLGASTTADSAAATTQQRGMLVTGGFLVGTGAMALVGGLVITLKSRGAK